MSAGFSAQSGRHLGLGRSVLRHAQRQDGEGGQQGQAGPRATQPGGGVLTRAEPPPQGGPARSAGAQPRHDRPRRLSALGFFCPIASLAFHACVALFHRQLLSCRLLAVAALFGVLRRVSSFHSGRVCAAAPSGVSQGVHVGSRSRVAGRASPPGA